MYDVALEQAQVIWCDYARADGSESIVVVGVAIDDDYGFDNSWGSCNSEYNAATPDLKLALLMAQGLAIASTTNISVTDIHKAFSVIPEYRSVMAVIGLSTSSGHG
jgi:hypothetical protein